LDRIINIIRWTIRKFQIEKHQIELLFLERAQRFFNGTNHYPTEADFAEEQFEKILQTFVVVHDENSWLAGLVLLENILVEEGFFDAPATADLDGGQLAALDQVVHRRQGDTEVFGGFLDRQEVMHGRKSPNW